MKTIARNKKAHHNYFIEETFEVGIVLKGTEIKSIRQGKVSIQDSYVRMRHKEALIINMHVAKFKEGAIFNHDETRERKLLMHKQEIIRLETKLNQQNATLIPLEVYLKEGLCKLKLDLRKGKRNTINVKALKKKI